MGVCWTAYCEKHKEQIDLDKYPPFCLMMKKDDSKEKWIEAFVNELKQSYDSDGKRYRLDKQLRLLLFLAKHNGCEIKVFSDADEDEPEGVYDYEEFLPYRDLTEIDY